MEHKSIGNTESSDFLALDRVGLKVNKVEFKQHARILLGHIIDSHIVVLYRILSISRGDDNPLPGGNQDLWARTSGLPAV